MTKKTKIVLGISAAILLALVLAAISVFYGGRYFLRKAFWMEPYDESHPASILVTIEDNSVVKFPEKIESLKAADRTSRGIDSAHYNFILRFKTDQNGLAQLRESLSQLDRYIEDDVKPDQRDYDFDLRISRKNKLFPEWYSEELPEGVVYTSHGKGVVYSGKTAKGKFHYISCTCVTLAGSEEVVVFMEGVGYYSLKDYGD
ncbi:MAG: hypothetical protein ACYSWZ_24685 [Planctomycetota bacterium]|jgi:hypothetical protein